MNTTLRHSTQHQEHQLAHPADDNHEERAFRRPKDHRNGILQQDTPRKSITLPCPPTPPHQQDTTTM